MFILSENLQIGDRRTGADIPKNGSSGSDNDYILINGFNFILLDLLFPTFRMILPSYFWREFGIHPSFCTIYLYILMRLVWTSNIWTTVWDIQSLWLWHI